MLFCFKIFLIVRSLVFIKLIVNKDFLNSKIYKKTLDNKKFCYISDNMVILLRRLLEMFFGSIVSNINQIGHKYDH